MELQTSLGQFAIGDEVILPSPTYASYIEQITLAGGIPIFVPLTDTWGLDLPAIREAITPRTRAIILCNPGNPTGTVFSDDETLALCRQAVADNFVIITDEAYDYMVYDGDMPLSPLCMDEFRDHVISIYSLSPCPGTELSTAAFMTAPHASSCGGS